MTYAGKEMHCFSADSDSIVSPLLTNSNSGPLNTPHVHAEQAQCTAYTTTMARHAKVFFSTVDIGTVRSVCASARWCYRPSDAVTFAAL